MKEVKLTAVSFINTRPLVYKIDESPLFDVEYRVPSRCADKLKEGNTDCGLIPVIEYTGNYQIVSDICIASEKEVASVLLVGNIPIVEMETVHLDTASRTSAALVKILFSRKYNMNVDFTTEENEKSDGKLVIGDRAIKVGNEYDYRYDLASEWKDWQGLPFVFAFWAFPEGALSDIHINELKDIRSAGLENIDEIVEECEREFDFESDFLYRYFTSHINYHLDEKKLDAVRLFFKLASEEDIIHPEPELKVS